MSAQPALKVSNTPSSYTNKLPIKRRGLLSNLLANIERWIAIHIKEGLLYRGADQKFFQLMGGHILFQNLAAAVEFDLFNILEQSPGLNEEQIAQLLRIELQPCRILLLGLANTNLINRDRSGIYRNSRLAKIYLTKGGQWKYHSCVRWQNHINYRAMGHFFEALTLNRNVGLMEIPGSEATLYQRLAHNPKLEKLFQDAMQEISAQSNGLLTRFVDFSSIRFLVDVGGGNATNIIRIASAFPHLRACVFDFPTVCDLARHNIAEHGLGERLSAVAGNIFETPLPAGADCILFCHFFTIWSGEENRRLLQRAYDALPKGGRAMIFNMMQNNNRRGPASAAVGSPYFLTLATGRGMLYCWDDYKQFFHEAGFADVQSIRLPRDHGVIVGIKR